MNTRRPEEAKEKELTLGEPGYFRIHVEDTRFDTRIASLTVSKHDHMGGRIEKLARPEHNRGFVALGKFHGTHYTPDTIGENLSGSTEAELAAVIRRKQHGTEQTNRYVFDFGHPPREESIVGDGDREGKCRSRRCTPQEEQLLRDMLEVQSQKDVGSRIIGGVRAVAGRLKSALDRFEQWAKTR